MKNQSQSILLSFFVLLVSFSGCKKQIEVERETTLKPPTCLITTQTIKESVSSSQQSKLDLETVIIGNESVQVSTTKKSVYSYDTKGRILTEYNQYAGNKADSIYYQHTPKSVIIRKVNLTTTPTTSSTQVVELNSQGLVERPGYAGATYDNDGYLLTRKSDEIFTYTINNGNVMETLFAENPAVPSYTIKNEYDLNKPGLPHIQTFYGIESRNLLVKYTIKNNWLSEIYGSVYTGTYIHTLDDKSRVKRQIFRGKNGDPGYIYGSDNVTVRDFTYTSP